MRQYLDLLREVLEHGELKKPAREGMPSTLELFARTMKFDLSEGFPLLTTKKVYFKGVLAELLWFFKGDTNIKYLVENNVFIWNDDAYKYYLRLFNIHKNYEVLHYSGLSYDAEPVSKEEFLLKVLNGEKVRFYNSDGDKFYYTFGDCGNIYGFLWNKENQLYGLVQSINENPESRYHILNAWIPSLIKDSSKLALPPCHVMYQFNVSGGRLNMMMYQRSCDMFLGVPFNIASGALFCTIVAKMTGYEPGEFTWVGGSCHIYENQIDAVKTQLSREPINNKAEVLINIRRKGSFRSLEISDFELINYKSYPSIHAPLSVGV